MPVLCWFLVPVREGAPPRDKELLLEAGLEEASEGALERKDIVGGVFMVCLVLVFNCKTFFCAL